MFHKLTTVVLCLILFGCASGHLSTSLKLRDYVASGDVDKAINHLKKSDLAGDKKSVLLYQIELGLLEHFRGEYAASNVAFSSAKEMIDALFTTRVSGKLKSFLTNDNSDFYYGEKFEASLVYFYLSLNHYMMAIKENDLTKKKQFLESARAEVVAWDSFLTEIKNERLGKALFKNDLLAKIFGGLIHEAQGSQRDDQIALQLYKDAQRVFFTNYNLYPTYNNSFESFRKNFTHLADLPQKEVAGKYVLATEHNKDLENFLSHKIAALSQKSKDAKNKGIISFLIQEGLIAQKVPQRYEFPIVWGAHESMALTLGMGLKIGFELPRIHDLQKLESSKLEALNQEGVVLQEVPLSIIAPVSELAEQAINEHSSSIAIKTAARVAAKHMTALVAAAATYELGKAKNDSMPMLIATAGHAAAVATINESEKADVRFWSTLPASIRLGQMTLPSGTYKFRVVLRQSGEEKKRVIDLGEHHIAPTKNIFVLHKKELNHKVSKRDDLRPIKLDSFTPKDMPQESPPQKTDETSPKVAN